MKVSICTNRPILSKCGLKDIEYQVDTYVGCEHYCNYCYALAQAETDWSKEILIHNHIIDQLIDMLEPYADVIWIYGLSINDRSDQNWLNIQTVLKSQFPDLMELVEATIFSKDHDYWIQLRASLDKLKKDRQLNLNIHL